MAYRCDIDERGMAPNDQFWPLMTKIGQAILPQRDGSGASIYKVPQMVLNRKNFPEPYGLIEKYIPLKKQQNHR